MTEEEARDKWCPQTFNAEAPDRCIASECAVWVWDMVYPEIIDPGFSEKQRGVWSSGGAVHVCQEPSTTDGHCGLIR